MLVEFITPSFGDINLGELVNALTLVFLYCVFSWFLWKRTSKKLTQWFEVLFRICFPISIAFIQIYFFQNWYICIIALPTLAFWALTRRGKVFLRENMNSLANHLTIINEAGEEPEYEDTEIFENPSQKAYNVEETMTRNAKRLGNEIFQKCEEIIQTVEGGEINVYYTWMNYDGKFQYIQFLYLHSINTHYKVPKVLSMNNVKLDPTVVYDRKFEVFFAIAGERNEEMLEYLKKWKRVYETAKIFPVYDDYVGLQEENTELKARLIDSRKRRKEFKGFLKGEKEEDDD